MSDDELVADLALTLHTLDPYRPGPTLAALLQRAHDRHGGVDGVRALALQCARMVTQGMVGRTGNYWTNFGGDAVDGQPVDGADVDVSAFITAYLNAGDTGALAEFDRWQPADAEQPTERLQAALFRLLNYAWMRQRPSGGQRTVLGPGSSWPPICDFCCHARASRMFGCAPFGLHSEPGDPAVLGGEGIELEYTDPNWYACRRCTTLVEADNWPLVLRRHRTFHPADPSNPVGEGNMLRGWAAFRRYRLQRRSKALPKQPPQS